MREPPHATIDALDAERQEWQAIDPRLASPGGITSSQEMQTTTYRDVP